MVAERIDQVSHLFTCSALWSGSTPLWASQVVDKHLEARSVKFHDNSKHAVVNCNWAVILRVGGVSFLVTEDYLRLEPAVRGFLVSYVQLGVMEGDVMCRHNVLRARVREGAVGHTIYLL